MSQTVKKIAKVTYSFIVDGGAISTITPFITDYIPSGAIITNVIFSTGTALTSGGAATVAVTGGGVTLVAAQTLTNNMLDTLNIVALMKAAGNAGASSTVPYIAKLTTSRTQIQVVVAVATLTAGTVDIYVEYMI